MINWNNNAKSAVQAYDSWLYCNDTGNMIASEALEKFMEDVVFAPKTKTVKDVYEAHPDGWDAVPNRYEGQNTKGEDLVLWDAETESFLQGCEGFCEYTYSKVCTKEQLEDYVEKSKVKPKTVKDAVEWAGGEWEYAGLDVIVFDGEFLYGLGGKTLREVVCTREEFEAYVNEQCSHEWLSADNEVVQGASVCTKCKAIVETAAIEQEGEKWTHVDSEGDKCKILAEYGMWVWVIFEGYGSPDKCEKGSLKPIKPMMTKEQHEFLCKFSVDSNNMTVIAEVESYLARHDII